MEEKKTVAERLREYNGSSIDCFLVKVVGRDHLCSNFTHCDDCMEAANSALADQIEAEQAELREKVLLAQALTKGAMHQLPEGIVWPRFEDGELVRFGDEYLNEAGSACTFRRIEFKQDFGYKMGKGANHRWRECGEPVKRPEPEVLDADGVPIRVGDTVYSVPDGREGVVERVGKGLNVRYGYRDVSVLWPGYTAPYLEQGGNLTHRKPDTFESVAAELLADFDANADGGMEMDGYIERFRKLLGGVA